MGSNTDQCYIQIRVVMNRVIKRSRCIINCEYFENFPNSGFMSLNFPIRKALGPLPKIAKKIPAFDPNIHIGHCDLISRFSDFALYLDALSVYFHTFFR